MNTTKKTGHYINTPHKTIEEIAIMAAQRVRNGEKADAVLIDVIDGYELGYGSKNYWFIKEKIEKDGKPTSEQAKRKAICYHVSTEQVTNTANFLWHPWIDDGGDVDLLRGMVVNKYIRECLPGVEKARIYLYEASDKTYPSGRPMSVQLMIYDVTKQERKTA